MHGGVKTEWKWLAFRACSTIFRHRVYCNLGGLKFDFKAESFASGA